jgi:hypothetical protein
MNIKLSNGSRSKWDETKPVRILLTGMLKGEQGALTGKWEEQDFCGEPVAMLEVSHAFGTDYIFEYYLSQ